MSESLLYELPDFHVNFCSSPHFSSWTKTSIAALVCAGSQTVLSFLRCLGCPVSPWQHAQTCRSERRKCPNSKGLGRSMVVWCVWNDHRTILEHLGREKAMWTALQILVAWGKSGCSDHISRRPGMSRPRVLIAQCAAGSGKSARHKYHKIS